MKYPNGFIYDEYECQKCGQRHQNLMFKKVSKQDYIAICPLTGEVLLLILNIKEIQLQGVSK